MYQLGASMQESGLRGNCTNPLLRLTNRQPSRAHVRGLLWWFRYLCVIPMCGSNVAACGTGAGASQQVFAGLSALARRVDGKRPQPKVEVGLPF